jgi:uncharacterized protein DUF4124
MRIFIITVICLALASPAFAGLYKWTDKNGKIHFSDSLKDVPLDQRNKKHITKMKSSRGGGKSNVPSAAPAPVRKHLKARKAGTPGGDAGVDKQRVNDLLRLNQKKHYDH